MDVCTDALENDSINGCGTTALITVESEIPSIAAACAAHNTNNTHVYHTQEGPRLQLGKIACLYFGEKSNTNTVCENIRFSDAAPADGNTIDQAKRERLAK